MKRYGFVFILFTILISGCSNHFYEIRKDRLYIYLKHSEAQNVQLRCSLDGYKEHPATKIDDDLWEVSVPFSSDMAYFYIIDNEVFLPACPFREKDDFGTENCIFVHEM